jgi:predicted nucleotidyltransferase
MPKMGIQQNRRARRKSASRSEESAMTAPANMADALFSKTQQRLLSLLFGQPDRSFFANELISLARSGTGAVQRELRRLTDSGLLTVTRIGNQKHFQANHVAPLFHELQSIVLKTTGLANPLRAALAPLVRDIQLAIVYGSVAKRTDHAASDVDLLIVSDNLTLESVYAALSAAEHKMARKISPTLYSAEEFQRKRKSADSFISKVLMGEHIVLLGAERDVEQAR